MGGGGQEDSIAFPITFIVHNQKSNRGRQWGGGHRVNGGGGMAPKPLLHKCVSFHKHILCLRTKLTNIYNLTHAYLSR